MRLIAYLKTDLKDAAIQCSEYYYVYYHTIITIFSQNIESYLLRKPP